MNRNHQNHSIPEVGKRINVQLYIHQQSAKSCLSAIVKKQFSNNCNRFSIDHIQNFNLFRKKLCYLNMIIIYIYPKLLRLMQRVFSWYIFFPCVSFSYHNISTVILIKTNYNFQQMALTHVYQNTRIHLTRFLKKICLNQSI